MYKYSYSQHKTTHIYCLCPKATLFALATSIHVATTRQRNTKSDCLHLKLKNWGIESQEPWARCNAHKQRGQSWLQDSSSRAKGPSYISHKPRSVQIGITQKSVHELILFPSLLISHVVALSSMGHLEWVEWPPFIQTEWSPVASPSSGR